MEVVTGGSSGDGACLDLVRPALCFDGESGFGANECVPAGKWRTAARDSELVHLGHPFGRAWEAHSTAFPHFLRA